MIFVLGIERSATTWVANILDHHPETDVYMEPLSGFISGFEQWPDRFTILADLPERAAYFREEFKSLKTNRRFLFTRLSDTPRAWQFDLKIAHLVTRKGLANKGIRNFLELNYHRKDRTIPVRKQPPLQTVIKELRLNFNAGLIATLDTQARVVIVIRDVASCARSILNQLEKGNLVELQKDLTSAYGDISPEQVARYWRESYSTLLTSLENGTIPYTMVSHTALLESPRQTVEEFLHFLGFDLSPVVIDFLAYSDKPGSGKHSTRRSRNDLLKQMQKDRDKIYPLITDELYEIELHPVLKNYISHS